MTGLHLSRSRPYQKNDNRLVEQKTPRWCGPTWATCAWTPPDSVRPSTPSMISCGCTTTCSTRCSLCGQGGGRREAPPPVGPGPDPLPAIPGQQHPLLGAATEGRRLLCRDEPSTVTGSHLPGDGTAVAAPQGSPATQPKGVGSHPSLTFLNECTTPPPVTFLYELTRKALFNNGYLGMVRQWQELFYETRYKAVPIPGPEYVKLAEAFGIPAVKVTHRREVMPALQQAQSHPGPFLIDFVLQPEENVYPMVPLGASLAETVEDPRTRGER